MFREPQTSIQTIAIYNADADRFIDQYAREMEPEASYIPYESLVEMAVRWFLNSHGRWSKSYIRRLAAALRLRVELLVAMEMIDDDPHKPEKSLLRALKNNRPQPAKRSKKQSKKSKRKRNAYRKSVTAHELRRIISYFCGKADSFSLWIAGYISIASRLGWRPGEIVLLWRDGDFVRANAEKNSNERGLTDTCEVKISAYPEWLVGKLDRWIADVEKWEERYHGIRGLLSSMNGRLATACKNLGIRRVCTYTLRHFAISCMKRSGFTRTEIAVLVNHASNRTAGERYGRGRGIKRARKMLDFQQSRILLVREKARTFGGTLKPEQSPVGLTM